MRYTIGIDVSPLARQQYTGTEQYVHTLITELVTLPESKKYHWIVYSPKPQSSKLVLPPNWRWKQLAWPFTRMWIRGRLSLEMLRERPDVLFIPANRMPIVTPKRVVTTIHDIAFREIPNAYSRRQYYTHRSAMRAIEKKGATVIAISNATANQLSLYYPGIKISGVVPLAVTVERTSDFSKTKNDVKKPYYLHIGTRGIKKNISYLLALYEALRKNGDNRSLVVVGGEGYGYKEIDAQIANHRFKQDIYSTGWIPRSEELALLRQADALFISSLHEGFSLPILEAQQVSVPVILSDIPVHREVAGRGALFVSMQNIEEDQKKITLFINDKQSIAKSIADGKNNCTQFLPTPMAQRTLEIITNVLR